MAFCSLNQSAWSLCEDLERQADRLRVAGHRIERARVWDFGVEAPGGLAAGSMLARICLADLGHVRLERGHPALGIGAVVTVSSDFPVPACLGAQYAGWQLQVDKEKYFAMASGPMRALTGRESLIDQLELAETADMAVGVLEASELPSPGVCEAIAAACGVPLERLTLCVAPTSSLAGSMQIVARSIETALHKLHELDFDVTSIYAGWGCAPLPPATRDDLVALGWTNDAILYGARVVLWVDGDDQQLREVVSRVPSDASRDYGRPFGEIFREYQKDFYRIDPLLFSPAMITINNRTTGHTFTAGRLADDILRRSFQVS